MGGPATFQFSLSEGQLPSGLSLNATTGELYGTPTSTGGFAFTVNVQERNERTSQAKAYIMRVNPPKPRVTISISPTDPTVAAGGHVQFGANVTNTSNTAVQWGASAGAITSNGLFTAPATSGVSAVTVTATSLAEPSAQASTTVSLTASSPLRITTSSLPPAVVGSPYSTQMTASGGEPPYRWSIISGSLPAGFAIEGSSGIIQGSTAQSGSFPLSARVMDAAGHTSQQNQTLSVSNTDCGPPTYPCSRGDASFAAVPSPMPSWGGLDGTNTVVTDQDFHNPIEWVKYETLGVVHEFCTGLGGSGDVPQLWNADSTILLICDEEGQYFPIGFDPVNFKSLGPLYGTNPTIYKSGPGVFSHTDPNRFYSIKRGQLRTIDYTDRTTPPTPELLYDFANCGIGTNIGWQSIGGTDPTDTIFSAGFSLIMRQGTGYFVAVYNSSTHICFNLNTSTGVVTKYPGAMVVGTVDIPDRFYIHNVKMKGATTLVVSPQSCIANCGPHPYAWVIGTTQMYGLGHPKGGGHWAVGCGKWLNQPGDLFDYNVTRDYLNPTLLNPVWSVSSSQCGAAPRMSCVQPFDSHPAWLGDCSDTGPVCMATVAPHDILQYPYQNEIVCFTTDGSNRQIRFAHTYSSIALGGFGAQESIGQPSQDGRFYAWTTKAGGQFGCTDGTFNCLQTERRSDVLVVKLQ